MARHVLEAIVIDQNGDAIITLTNPGLPFAIWEPKQEEPNRHDAVNTNGGTEGKEKQDVEEPGTCDEGAMRKISKRPAGELLTGRSIRCKLPMLGGRDPDGSTAVAENSSNVTTFDLGDASAGHEGFSESQLETEEERGEAGSTQSEHEPTETPEPAVTYRVSAKHLELASGKFKSELIGSWAEGIKGEDGFYHLMAEDWDPEVFDILLNILHLRNRHVPPRLHLEKLAKMAVLVDYYRCWEAVEMWTNIWIQEVRKTEPVPTSYSRNLILWILVSWVFGLEQEFEKTTAIALRQSQTPVIRDMGLPIPPLVIEGMELQRHQLINAVILLCHNLIEKFRDNYTCQRRRDDSPACGTMLLGALTREMHRHHLSPRPEIPFAGLSFESICKTMKEVDSPQWRDNPGHYSSLHPCSLRRILEPQIDLVMRRIGGLNLRDFIDRAKQLEQQ